MDMVWQGVVLAILIMISYTIGYYLEVGSFADFAFKGAEQPNAIAMAFLTCNFVEMFTAMSMRSRTGSIFSKSMFKNMNWWIVGAFFVTTILTLAAIYIPGLNDVVFGIKSGTFSPSELAIAIGLALLVFPIFELGKLFRRLSLKKKNK